MNKRKKNCEYKSAITKNQLLYLLAALGHTFRGGHFGHPLTPTMMSLYNRGLLEIHETRIYSAMRGVEYHNGKDCAEELDYCFESHLAFDLTSRGQNYLKKWTLEELVAVVNAIPGEDSFFQIYPLYYLISKMPLEMLPEYLTHLRPNVRRVATDRRKELVE